MAQDFTVNQGATKRFSVVYSYDDNGEKVPYDLTNCSARMQLRSAPGGDLYLTLATPPDGSGITITPAEGKLDVLMTATQTTAITVRRAVYDLELKFPDQTVVRLIEGTFTFSPEVTTDSDE